MSKLSNSVNVFVILGLILFFSMKVEAQYLKNLKGKEFSASNLGYNEYTISENGDTISFYIYNPENMDKNFLFLYLQGSVNMPLYNYKVKKNKDFSVVSTVPFDLDTFPKEYAFVVISKAGLPFAAESDITEHENEIDKKDHLLNTLEGRVKRANRVLNYLLDNEIIKDPSRVVVLGHSEGADVAAKLATLNDKITHVGYWSGGGATQLYDFVLRTLRQYHSNKISFQQMDKEINTLLGTFKEIISEKNSTEKIWEENTYLRWASFSVPPIENLLKIDVPIFVAIGSRDEAVSIENTYLIPLEFIRNGKDNLTFKVYENYDHGMEEFTKNQMIIDHWQEVTIDFLKWIENN